MNNIDSLKNKRIWFMISGFNVSGSESRAVKVAAFFAQKKIFKEVFFVVNGELIKEYKKNKVIAQLLFNSNITIINKNKQDSFLFANEKVNHTIIKSYLSKLFFNGKIFNALYRRLLIKFSWSGFIKKNIKENDIVHGIYGWPVRVGIWDMSQKLENTFIIEKTAPVGDKRYRDILKTMYKSDQKAKNLYFVAVTKTSYEIFKTFLSDEFFSKHNIRFLYYEGPFVNILGQPEKKEKENIIIFPHRFFGRKNAPLFAKAIKELLDNSEIDGWKIYFRGTGQDEAIIKETLNKYNDNQRIVIGYTNNISDDFAKSKICVSIISTDNIPSNSIYESLKHGNLQILSDTGYTKKVLNHPDFFFCDLNLESLCNAIRRSVKTAESNLFYEKSEEMRRFYTYLEDNNLYVKKALEIYTADTNP